MVEALPFELMELPDEILLMVMRFLDFESLLDALYVNKHFCELVEPFVYESITVLHGEKARNLSHSLSKDRRRPAWVRSLLVSTKFGQEHDLIKLPPAICHMSNLEELRLETPDCNRKKPEEREFWIQLQDYYERIFRQSSVLILDHRDRLLPNLKSCVLHFVDTHTELYSLSRYASIFLHPRLESLTISCMSTDFPETLFNGVENIEKFYGSTNLQCLHLEECDIHPPSLEMLLSFPKALKSLKISEGIRYDGFFRAGFSRLHGNVKPRPFAQVLVNTCKDSLVDLSLALGYVRPHGNEINHAGHYLKLNELENLKHLEVTYRTLNLLRSRPECDHGTWKRLPPSLETFKVCAIPLLPAQQDARQAHVPLKSCIVTDKQLHGVPNLKKIIYSYEHQESIDDDDMNFNDLLLTLVHNRVNDNPPDHPAPNIPAHPNPVLNVIQQAMGVAIQPAQPANPTFVTAAMNPNLDTPPQNIRPPRFRWRTTSQQDRPNAHPELSRSDNAKLSLLKTIHDSILSDFIKAQTRLQVDLVTLPRGFIPPYLFPEDKPTIHEAWFTSTKPLTPSGFLNGIRRQRELARQHLSNVHTSSDEDEDYESERARSRSRFLRRMLDEATEVDDDDFDPQAGNLAVTQQADMSDDDGDDSTTDEDGELEVEFADYGEEHPSDVDSDTSDSSASGSIYVDAGTDVEMSEVEADVDEDEDDEHVPSIPTHSSGPTWTFGRRIGRG